MGPGTVAIRAALRLDGASAKQKRGAARNLLGGRGIREWDRTGTGAPSCRVLWGLR